MIEKITGIFKRRCAVSNILLVAALLVLLINIIQLIDFIARQELTNSFSYLPAVFVSSCFLLGLSEIVNLLNKGLKKSDEKSDEQQDKPE